VAIALAAAMAAILIRNACKFSVLVVCNLFIVAWVATLAVAGPTATGNNVFLHVDAEFLVRLFVVVVVFVVLVLVRVGMALAIMCEETCQFSDLVVCNLFRAGQVATGCCSSNS